MRLLSSLLTACVLATATLIYAQVPTVYRVAPDFRQCDLRSAAVGPDGSVYTVSAMKESTTMKHFSATGTELWSKNLDRELANRISTGSLHAHGAGVDLFVQSLRSTDTVTVYQFTPTGDLLGTVSLTDAKAGPPTFRGLYADASGYILVRFSTDPAYQCRIGHLRPCRGATQARGDEQSQRRAFDYPSRGARYYINPS